MGPMASLKRVSFRKSAARHLAAVSIVLSLIVIGACSWLIVEVLPASTRTPSSVIAPSDLLVGVADVSRADARLILALVATALLAGLGVLALFFAARHHADGSSEQHDDAERWFPPPKAPALMSEPGRPVSSSIAARALDEELGTYGSSPNSRPGVAWLRTERGGRGAGPRRSGADQAEGGHPPEGHLPA